MQLKEIDLFRPESLWDTARLAIGVSALGALLVDQVNTHCIFYLQIWIYDSTMGEYSFFLYITSPKV
jgi:hypothetical protein